MDISIKLEVEDWYQFQSYLAKELPKAVKSWTNSFWFGLIVWAAIAILFMSVSQITSEFHWPTASIVSVFFILLFALYIFNLIKFKKACAPSEAGAFIGDHQFVFDEEGIKSQGYGYEGKHSWLLVQRIERTNGMILIFLDTAYAFVFPESKLEDPEQLYNYIIEQYKNI
ncbi:MAG: YcxB family protein [Xanthomonadales bacterium]|nr:YcxB family protein [Xanthomonadales bacterium]